MNKEREFFTVCKEHSPPEATIDKNIFKKNIKKHKVIKFRSNNNSKP